MATRRVLSGSYPLYRLIMIGVLASCVAQLVTWQVPASVQDTSAGMFDGIYLGFQSVGAVLVLASFRIRRAMLSLQVERVGAIASATAGLMYFTAVVLSTGAIPITSATWGTLAMALYLAWRAVVEIPREITAVQATALRIVEGVQ